FCKTPFVFLTDRKYKRGTDAELEGLFAKMRDIKANGFKYKAEDQDCDDFASVFKGEASKAGWNWVGTCFGFTGWKFWNLHAWNIALMDGAVVHIEPQGPRKVSKSYHALVVIL
ncbi:MAG: hypothetical protein PHQ43_08835, partial [Dehalococcoidales bacterium]|nr:hypothetical protein [Dehalococcoidales bacterium]